MSTPTTRPYRDQPDEEVALAYYRGQERAATEIERRYRPRLEIHFRWLGLPEQVARDGAQNVLDRFRHTHPRVGKGQPYNPELGAFRSWLLTIAHHVGVDLQRQQHRPKGRTRDFTSVTPDEDSEGCDEFLGTPEPSDKELEEAAELRAVVAAGLAHLDAREREALALFLASNCEMTATELAAYLGVSVSTGWRVLQSALHHMGRDLLRHKYHAYDEEERHLELDTWLERGVSVVNRLDACTWEVPATLEKRKELIAIIRSLRKVYNELTN
jgi:RNA polymerase sigma factor (sigma-70 family)